MRLHRLKISGYRRLKEIELHFGDATFLIGQNNCGKSTILRAIETLLSAKKTLSSNDYHSIIDEETKETKPDTTIVQLEGEFRNLPEESRKWRGFKGRIFNYETETETGLSVTYRKTYELGKDVVVEFKSKNKTIKEAFDNCRTPTEYIAAGIEKDIIESIFPELDKNIGKSKEALEKLDQLDEIFEFTDEDIWFQNPGGIPGNVLKMLPRYLLIPVDSNTSEIQGNSSGVLGKTLNELFEMVRESSDNFKEAQKFLDELSKELDPKDTESEFGKMMTELNVILASIFPNSVLHASTNLSDPSKVLKPSFEIEMSSNVKTNVENQGTGMVRAAVFGMLRFRQKWLSRKEDEHARSLIICFEEPEIYLNPSAANQMRDVIYELSTSTSQIVASTHSPYIIDISRKPRQILNRLKENGNTVENVSFSVTDSFNLLLEDDKSYVKMLLKIDDYIARAFFTNHVVIVEGDTEDILLRESITRLPKPQHLSIISNFEIIKARGKAAIIGLVKYLTAMGIKPIVVHDKDSQTPNAKKYNVPIENALNGNGRIVLMKENVEDEIGYEANSEKPFKAYQQTLIWEDNWQSIPANWRSKLKEIFGDYIQEE